MKQAVLALDMTRDSIAPEARAVEMRRAAGFPTTVVSDLTVAHAWGGHTVEETQKWSLEFIAAMAKSRIARSDELMQ